MPYHILKYHICVEYTSIAYSFISLLILVPYFFLYFSVSTSLAFVLSLPPIFGWTNYSYAPIQSICFSDWAKAPSYAIFMISCCFGCPLFVMLICNLMILREVRRRNRRVMNRKKIHFKAVVNVITGGNNLNRKLTPATFTNIGETSSGGSDTITICSESEVIEKQVVCSIPLDDLLSTKEATNRAFQIQIKSTPTVNESHCKKEKAKKTDKSRISQPPTVSASRSEIRLARMLCIVVVVFAICWSPYCVSMLFTIYWQEIFLPRSFHMTTLLIGYFNSSCNPIIYGVLNKRFGKEFRRIFNTFRQCSN